jgi:hypothetical protein
MASSVAPAFAGGSGAAWAETANRASNPAQVEIVIRIILSASNVLLLHNSETLAEDGLKSTPKARGWVCRANAKSPR